MVLQIRTRRKKKGSIPCCLKTSLEKNTGTRKKNRQHSVLFWKVLGRHHRHSDINACRNVYTYTQTIKKHKTLLRLTARLQARAPDIAANCTRKCSRPKGPSLKNPRLLGACLGSSFSVLSRSASGQGRRPQVAPRSVQVAGRTSQLAGHRSHGAPRCSRVAARRPASAEPSRWPVWGR